jgi:hypothetical protein
LGANLAEVGSSCAVKWWGDRVVIRIHTAARYLDPAETVEAMMQSLEADLKSAAIGKE